VIFLNRLFIVSNRLPSSAMRREGKIILTPSAGGLATGLSSFFSAYDSLWIGWPGIVSNSSHEREEILEQMQAKKMKPVFLTRRQIEKYYEGFSNKTIWPLFHYFNQYVVNDKRYWETYHQVNQQFCDEVAQVATEDDIIWVHDYQLMLLPGMLRERLPGVTIGFFLHIPFPSFELFRTLPWRTEILSGMLGADLVGFHTYDYARHFISAVTRILGVDHSLMKLTLEDRTIRADSFPMGIDFDKFFQASQKPSVKKEVKNIRSVIGERKIILSVDRLDYSKAITQRLRAFNQYLECHPGFREKVSLVMVVVPSRTKVEHYKKLKIEVDELVGYINGKFSTLGWTPIWYLYRNLPFDMLAALYLCADVGLVTPYRDGMNLVAKEFIASKHNGKGALILSEMAGAADEMSDIIMVNPSSIDEIEAAINKALHLAEDDQLQINREIQKKLKRYNVCRWAEDFIETLLNTKDQQKQLLTKSMDHQIEKTIINSYQSSQHRLLLLDYDGTLKAFSKDPEKVEPDDELIAILKKLTDQPQNAVVIISGRKRETLEKWFGDLKVDLVGEHGVWLRINGADWELIEKLESDWKQEILPILELYVDRTPGSFVETKDYSLVWHYRKADPGQGIVRARELVDHLIYLTSNLSLQVLEGNKMVEIKTAGVNKGRAAFRWIGLKKWDFIIALGDDWTDEDIFRVLPDTAYSIKVGIASTEAKYKIKSSKEVRTLLNKLAEVNSDENIK